MADRTSESTKTIPLGELLVKEGVITKEQLERVLRIQKKLKRRTKLGEILVEMGYVYKKQLKDLLKKYNKSIPLGDLLLEKKLITIDELRRAMEQQKKTPGRKLGDLLLEMELVNERDLVQTLAEQQDIPYIEPEVGMIDPTLLRGVSIEYLTQNAAIPFSRIGNTLTVVVDNPFNTHLLMTLKDTFKCDVKLALCSRDKILQVLEDFRTMSMDVDNWAGHVDDDEKVVEIVNCLIRSAIQERASDIHLEPMANRLRVRYRIDGVLIHKTDLPLELLNKINTRLKVTAEMDITESRRHQDGRALFDYGNIEVDLRLSFYTTVHGQNCVIRILNRGVSLVGLEELGMNSRMMTRYIDYVLDVPSGVVVVTGPTGSGKTTTLYSSLDYCNDTSRKIITVEDPVEYQIEGIMQCSVDTKIGRTFHDSLKSVVRQDPDIVVLGEIRDAESAGVAVEAALTGHKVFSTFHTEDSIGAILRLTDMKIETFLIASTLQAIVAQRLVRQICPDCKEAYRPTDLELQKLGVTRDYLKGYQTFKGRGCQACHNTGYSGRVGVYEMLILNEEVRGAILQRAQSSALRNIAVNTADLTTMQEDGITKVVRGVTTIEEILDEAPRGFGMRPIDKLIELNG